MVNARRLTTWLGGLVLALAIGASSAQSSTLVIALPVDIPIPDAHKATGLPAIGATAQVGDLLVIEEDGEFKPWLAESWTYEDDGRSLIFKIVDGVTAHDGSPVTNEDVVWSIARFRERSIGRSALAPVTEVVALDGNRVRVSTLEPFSPLLQTFTYSTITIYSKTAYDAIGNDDAFSLAPVGPGPFKFVEWIPGERMVLEAFDDYWAGRPSVDRIEFRVIRDEASRIAALEAGEVDVIHAFSPLEFQRLEGNAALVVWNPPSAGFIRLNMNTQRPPFDDVRVRQAVAHAIDRNELSVGLFGGTAPIARSLVPSEAIGYTADFDVYDYDTDRARALLAEAGVPNLRFTLTYGAGRYLLDSEVVTLVQAQMARIGVQVDIEAMEWAQYSQYIRRGPDDNTTDMTLTWWRTVNGDPDSAIGIFTNAELPPTGNNVPQYSSDTFEALYLAQQTEVDPATRLQVIRDLQEVLMTDLPAIPLYNQPQFWAGRANVSGFYEAITALSTLKPLYRVSLD